MNYLSRVDTQNVDILKQFVGGLAESTREEYAFGLRAFAKFVMVPEKEVAAWLLKDQGRTTLAAMEYRNELVEQKYAPNTINKRLAAIKKVVSFARAIGLVDWQLTVKSPMACVYRDTRGPGRDAVQKIIDTCTCPRNHLIFSLLFYMALRRSEVYSLDMESVDRGKLWVLEKRHTQRRPLTMPGKVLSSLSRWLVIRGTGDGPLFITNEGTRLGIRSINKLVRRAGQRVGIKCSPHGFRHTAITEAAAATGGDLIALMQYSRHTKLDTVKYYLDARDDGFGTVAELISRKPMQLQYSEATGRDADTLPAGLTSTD